MSMLPYSSKASVEELCKLCDYLAASAEESVFAFLFSDGEFRIAIGTSHSKKCSHNFYALSFDPEARSRKKHQFWGSPESALDISPRHLLKGHIHQEYVLESDHPEEFHNLWQQAQANADSNVFSSWKLNAANSKNEWNSLCAAIDHALAVHEVEKLVPARFQKLSLNTGAAGKWDHYFTKLCAQAGANTHKFLYKKGSQVFFGASPEQLFHIHNKTLRVPAIAGTRSLLNDKEAAIESLRNSQKDLHEHNLVVKSICESLRSLGVEPQHANTPECLVLPQLVHLYTPIEAAISAEFPVLSLLEKLHPTAAIGGYPKVAALALLAEHENWDRGHFSAPLGYINKEEGSSRFIVGIRSALFSPPEVYVFAGAGYVAGSTAEGEWLETEAKMRGILNLFTE